MKSLSFVTVITCALQLCTALSSAQSIITSDKKVFRGIREGLKQASIIDDVIDDFQPSCYLQPTFPSKHGKVSLGNTINPSQTKEPPAVQIICPSKHPASGPFTIILTDPDAPSRSNPKWSEICHWIVTAPALGSNPSEIESGEEHYSISSGLNEIVEFKPPGPPPKTGYHRYVFLLFSGENGNLTAPEDRQHWGFGKKGYGVKNWAEREGLEVVGANFFYARNEKQ